MATALTQTTLTAAISINTTSLPVAATTGLSAPTNNVSQFIYVIGPGQKRGELMSVISVGTLQVSVSRLGKYKSAFPSGSIVVIGLASNIFQSFQNYDPVGSSATNNSSSSGAVQVSPWINVENGNQWLFSSVLNCWVPGWNNTESPQVTALVSSAAGSIIPSGPLFHVDGTAAVTGFTNASMIGFAEGSFTIIPDAAFTWTNAGNIGLGGTAVLNKSLTFTWDANSGKWTPSYIA